MIPAMIAVCLGVLTQVPAPEPANAVYDGLRAERSAILIDSAVAPDPRRVTSAERFVPLPDLILPLPEPAPEPDAASAEAAARLLDLARKAADPAVAQFGLADLCLQDALDRDPANTEARKLQGYLPHEGGWATPYALQQIRQGKTLHARYGWVPESWVEHLERGELPGTSFQGDRPNQWLPAHQADALRASFRDRPWTITTQHFQIRTNVPLDEAIEFGRHLEILHDLFFRLLGDSLPRDRNPIARRLVPGITNPPTRRHEVWYFAERQEYLDYFRETFGRDESVSLGYYMPPDEAKTFRASPRSYFYRDPDNPIDATATLFHEASHQLLFENAGSTRYDRNRGHYWVWEALGTYFETARFQPDGTLSIGGLVGPRIAEARKRLVERDEFVPIEKLTAMSQTAFRDTQAIYLNYAEAMALATFLMNGDQAAYRDGFRDYVRDAYDGKLRGQGGLGQYLNLDETEIGRRFLKHLSQSAAESAP